MNEEGHVKMRSEHGKERSNAVISFRIQEIASLTLAMTFSKQLFLAGENAACLRITHPEPYIFSKAAMRSSIGGWVEKSLFTVPLISSRGLTM
jgi:hypothetical protein